MLVVGSGKEGGKDGGVHFFERNGRRKNFAVKFRGGIVRFQEEKSPVRQRLSSGRKFTRGVTF